MLRAKFKAELRRRAGWGALGLSLLLLVGCTSMVSEGTGAAAGVAGVAIANQITDNAAAATGIGLGVQAAAKAGLQYAQRRTRGEEQDAIADAASSLQMGEVADWQVDHALPLEPDSHGQVTVSRLVGGMGLSCKEIVFSAVTKKSVDPDLERQFYVSMICQDGDVWRWATAEPATSRWGSLQ
ncbi:hypothetical protein [Paenalcaligenes faecalis]|uniref:hypothetical protein n=1 Tax=Paenalcaligenes faecalis TaxID=2980099 RepID=UPI0022B978E1|nr:hypothetical protein [Paenalcaligenes faecalis]